MIRSKHLIDHGLMLSPSPLACKRYMEDLDVLNVRIVSDAMITLKEHFSVQNE